MNNVLNVDFKPMKKMKKRRELDALVNGKAPGGQRKKTKGQHELLRDNSESSDIEEFSIPEQTIVRKRTSSRACATCLMGCGFFLLMACIVAVVILVWVHVELKSDVYAMQANIRQLEVGNANTPDQFQQMHTVQQALQEKLDGILEGPNNIGKLQEDVTKALQQIEKLNETTKSLSKSLADTSTMKNLPETLQSLQQSIAKSASNSQVFHQSIDDLQKSLTTITATVDQLKLQISAMNVAGREGGTEVTDDTGSAESNPQDTQQLNQNVQKMIDVKQEMLSHAADITALNNTMQQSIDTLRRQHNQNTVLLEKVNNATQLLDNRLGLLEVGLSSHPANTSTTVPDMHSFVTQAVSSVMEELRNASIDSGAEAMSALDEQITEIKAVLRNTSQLDAVTQKQQLMSADLILLQQNLSKVSTTVTTHESRIAAVETAQQAKQVSDGQEATDETAQEETGMNRDEGENNQDDDKASTTTTTTTTTEGPVTEKPVKDENVDSDVLDQSEDPAAIDDIENPDVLLDGKQTTVGSTNSQNEADADDEMSTAVPLPIVSVPWIKTLEDGRTNFYRWDQDGDDYVLYDQLSDFLGPYLPDENLLKPYDKNKDNRYNLNEMLAAFGFPPYTAPKLDFDDEIDRSNTTKIMEFAEPPADLKKLKKLPFPANEHKTLQQIEKEEKEEG